MARIERLGEDGFIATGEAATRLVQMIAVRAAIRREQAGLRRGSGRSVKSMWAEEFGLTKRASYVAVLERIEQRIKELSSQIDRGDAVEATVEATGDGDVRSSGVEETY